MNEVDLPTLFVQIRCLDDPRRNDLGVLPKQAEDNSDFEARKREGIDNEGSFPVHESRNESRYDDQLTMTYVSWHMRSLTNMSKTS